MTFETGIFHECYKYSKNHNLPIKFVVEDGVKYIKEIVGFQIVNGGQTTASIHRAKKNDDIDLAINGDSFSEGQGGYPWVVEWQKKELKDLKITSLNYSIAGNGFEDFLEGSKHSKKYYNASKNIIFFIEHNAYRPYQRMSKNKSCSFYSNGILDNILGPLTCKTYGLSLIHI